MDSLISTAWLANHLGDADLLILDATAHLPASGRDAAAEFAAGHIPGARFLDLASLKDAASPVPNALPTGEQVAGFISPDGHFEDVQLIRTPQELDAFRARYSIPPECPLKKIY